MSPEEAEAWERQAGVRVTEVLEEKPPQEPEAPPVTVTLGQGVEAMRQSQSVRWAWGGVVAKELEWVAERAACMGRGKTKWLRAAVRGLRRVLVVANGRQQEAMQLWLEYRGTFSRVSADEPGAYAADSPVIRAGQVNS